MKIEKQFLLLILVMSSSIFCNSPNQSQPNNLTKIEYQEIIKQDYELSKPSQNIKAVLILLGGYRETATDIKREFNLLNLAKTKGIAILYMNFNQKLCLEQKEKIQLTEQLQDIFKEHHLPYNNICMGGFSSGGNLVLLLANHLVATQNKVLPKGLFIVDSPVDLLHLYKLAQKNIERNFSVTAVEEARWLIQLFHQKIGNFTNEVTALEQKSPFVAQTNSIQNISALQGLKIRFYTEPDTNWWKQNRQNEAEDLNAYSIEKLTKALQVNWHNNRVELIKTKNKGYRANGQRHPHSWSIVDQHDLINWLLP